MWEYINSKLRAEVASYEDALRVRQEVLDFIDKDPTRIFKYRNWKYDGEYR
jgi:hypothetical protein